MRGAGSTPPSAAGRRARRDVPLRVLIADDSAGAQRTICHVLEERPQIEVVGRARDGEEALRLALELKPDCILLDLAMPRMDGFTFLRLIMARRPVPVLVMSAVAQKGDVFKALELGALDFVPKPTAQGAEGLAALRADLLEKLATVGALRLQNLAAVQVEAPEPTLGLDLLATSGIARAPGRARLRRLAVVGASTGGPAALTRLFASLATGVPLAYVVAQHMPERFTRSFAERLGRKTRLEVKEAADGDELAEGRVLLAPGGHHLRVVREPPPAGCCRVRIARARPGDGHAYCPSVDLLFESAAAAVGDRLCAVVLTGMGSDGRRGVLSVKEAGGLVFAESERSAVIYGMPKEAAETGKVDEVLALDEMGARLTRFAHGG